jgi:hypothetical protein
MAQSPVCFTRFSSGCQHSPSMSDSQSGTHYDPRPMCGRLRLGGQRLPSSPLSRCRPWSALSLSMACPRVTTPGTPVSRSLHLQSLADVGTGSHPPLPTVDPLVFSLIRLAVLCFPLTSAAPDSLVDSLQLSGNLQGRALAGALLVGLMLAERL